MTKLLIFNFDGTSNEAEDAVQDVDNAGKVEDENITNILKFHLLCGGDLKESSTLSAGQISFYYSGIGTYGNFFQRLYNSGLSKEKFDVKRILNAALKDFENYNPGDRILVTGFSRGAALARRFASIINDKVTGDDIIEAVFDTVASIGLPNLKKSDRPDSEVLFEHNHTLPSKVTKALHCLSLDDKRKAFQPTLMNAENKIHEVWFAGAHSDVGGGYYFDGLSDITLRYMLEWVNDLAWTVNVTAPSDIVYANLLDEDADFKIEEDDVSIDPDVFGKNHQQNRTPFISLTTLTDRACVVIKDDKRTDTLPLVHHSVAQKIAGDREYRPQSLKGIEHKVIYDNGVTRVFTGFFPHKENVFGRLMIIQPGDTKKTVALAHHLYNRTGLFLEENAVYIISVEKQQDKEQVWRDASIECDADGWTRDTVEKGINELFFASMEPFRRVPKANWFCLCGAIGDTDDDVFQIGKRMKVTVTKSGELCLFANDLNRFYGNNFGKLTVHVERLS